MTSAKTVTPGQARARIPTTVASTPRRIKEVLRDFNMTVFLSFCLSEQVREIPYPAVRR
jgi:hypothetical protein